MHKQHKTRAIAIQNIHMMRMAVEAMLASVSKLDASSVREVADECLDFASKSVACYIDEMIAKSCMR